MALHERLRIHDYEVAEDAGATKAWLCMVNELMNTRLRRTGATKLWISIMLGSPASDMLCSQ
jgi:hypothetical protein